MATKGADCSIYHITGLPQNAFERSCIAMNLQEGFDAKGNPIPGFTPTPSSGGGSFFGIPLPGATWERHMMFRIGEVIVGIAMIVVGIKAFTNGGPTIKLITQTAKKAHG